MKPGQTYVTRVERSYVSKPLRSDSLDRAAAESRLARYRSLDQQFGDHGKKLLRAMFNRIQSRNRDVFGDKTLNDYLDMFSTSPAEIRADLRTKIFSLMVIYGRVNERVQLSSTVQNVKPNGDVVLKTTIDYYRLNWKPGGSYTTILLSSRSEDVEHEDPFQLLAPYRALIDRPFRMKITAAGNVLLGGAFKKLIGRARNVLKRTRSESHPIVLDLVRKRLLTKSYVRKFIYQAWFRPYRGSSRGKKHLENVVLLPPLYETGGLRRINFHLRNEADGKRTYRAMVQIRKDNDRQKYRTEDKKKRKKKLFPRDFSALYEVAGREDELFVDFAELNPSRSDVGTHAGGWMTTDTGIRHTTDLHYREVAYRSKQEVKDEVLSQLIYTGAPPYDDFEPLGSGYGSDGMYDATVEHPRGYRLVHRLNIGMTRSLRSE